MHIYELIKHNNGIRYVYKVYKIRGFWSELVGEYSTHEAAITDYPTACDLTDCDIPDEED